MVDPNLVIGGSTPSFPLREPTSVGRSRAWSDADLLAPASDADVALLGPDRSAASAPASTVVRPRSDRRVCERHGDQLHVISQSLFRDALTRAQRRGARFDQVFAVLYVRVREPTPWTRHLVVKSVCAAAGEGALVGWAHQDHEVGVILPEVGSTAAAVARDTELRIWRQLSLEFGTVVEKRVSIRVDLHESSQRREANALSRDTSLMEHDPAGLWRDISKRAMDVIGSVILLIVLTPVFLLIAILIKVKSPGPVLFKQVRLGRGAKPFTMLKFRTMQTDADPRLHQQYVESFIKANLPADPGDAKVFKMLNDPRITPIGRTLRRTSLDELPQFWNVLMGDMSLVGPRPPLQYELEQYRAWHWRRVLEAKPGVTGLWQVRGRSRTTFDEMVRLDLHYVRTRSLWLDFKILLATPRAVFTGEGGLLTDTSGGGVMSDARAGASAGEFACVAADVRLGRDVRLGKFINLYGCSIGNETRIGAFVEVQKNAVIGARCKISSHTFICEGVTIEDRVFVGHGVTFVNDLYPRATTAAGELQGDADWQVATTLGTGGASIGSGATILANVVIGEDAIVGAGSVVTKDVPARSVVAGNPARSLRSLDTQAGVPNAQ